MEDKKFVRVLYSPNCNYFALHGYAGLYRWILIGNCFKVNHPHLQMKRTDAIYPCLSSFSLAGDTEQRKAVHTPFTEKLLQQSAAIALLVLSQIPSTC